jgi:hypothetical protein
LVKQENEGDGAVKREEGHQRGVVEGKKPLGEMVVVWKAR